MKRIVTARKLLVLSVFALVAFLTTRAGYAYHLARLPPINLAEPGRVTNGVFTRWKYKSFTNFSEVVMEGLCGEYFASLPSSYSLKSYADPRYNHSEFPFLAYDEDRWMRQNMRDRKLAGERINREKLKASLSQEYSDISRYIADLQTALMTDIPHMRVWGHCALNHKPTSVEHNLKKYGRIAHLDHTFYPWVSEELPKFGKSQEIPITDANKPKESSFDEGFLQRYQRLSNGRGIVIPTTPETDPQTVKALIAVLRMLRNKLPIQIIHMGSPIDMTGFEDVAYGDFQAPDSYKTFLLLDNSEAPPDFPQQSVTMVDVSPAVVGNFTFEDVRIVAPIFTSFEEFIMLSPETILLVSPDQLFDIYGYNEHGMVAFKNPNILNQPRKPPVGYKQVRSFVEQLTPSKLEKSIFGFEDGHYPIDVDSSVLVLNKNKVLSGLLLSVSMRLQPLLAISQLDFFLLGQELSGATINVNRYPAVAVGKKSAEKEKNSDLASMSDELCTSSWGQMSHAENSELVYISAHQIINWHKFPETFQKNFMAKYPSIDGPLEVVNILRPIWIDQALSREHIDGEPDRPWIIQGDFSPGYPFWCTYNIIGSAMGDMKGLVVTTTKLKRTSIRYLVDVYRRTL